MLPLTCIGFLAVVFAAGNPHRAIAFQETQVVPNQVAKSTVGVSNRLQGLILPGSELEAIPITDHTIPIVLRVENSYLHGDSFRYDLIYYGLEPGKFDLRDYLQRIDKSTTDDLPSIPVEVVTLLPPGQVRPNELESKPSPRLGGYQLTLWLLGTAWVVGLLLLCFWGRGRANELKSDASRPLSLADQLRPLVERARNGELPAKERAELERLLLFFWQDKLDVSGLSPSKAIQKLKADSEAGKLLTSLEEWLHSPNVSRHEIDVASLLEPYQNISPMQSNRAQPVDRTSFNR